MKVAAKKFEEEAKSEAQVRSQVKGEVLQVFQGSADFKGIWCSSQRHILAPYS